MPPLTFITFRKLENASISSYISQNQRNTVILPNCSLLIFRQGETTRQLQSLRASSQSIPNGICIEHFPARHVYAHTA